MLLRRFIMKLNEDKITPVVIDLNVAKDKKINESFLSMFGGAMKMVLRRMFGDIQMPMVEVKGTKSQLTAFAEVLKREKNYMAAYVDLGLNNPATYKSKYLLDSAVRNFEEKTDIKWPFK